MKYVILHHPTKLPVIVLGLLVEHSDLAAPYQATGYNPTSAGFVRILGPGQFETFGWSSTLQLTPNRQDADVLAAMYAATLKTAPVVPAAPASTSTTAPDHA